MDVERALRIRTSYSSLLLLLPLAVALGSCEDEDPVAPPPPAERQPCFEMYVLNGNTCEPQLILDPSCLNEEGGTSRNYAMRWDWDGDGEWDTPFLGAVEVRYRPEGFISGFWRARCELKDRIGRITAAADSLDVTPLLPQVPDMKVRVFDFPAEPVVGVEYAIPLYYRCWVEGGSTVILRGTDGESPPVDTTIVCHPELVCQSMYWFMSFDKTGRHVVSLYIDPDNAYDEVDESNNFASAVLMVGSDESLRD
jgi:hypothetical protein